MMNLALYGRPETHNFYIISHNKHYAIIDRIYWPSEHIFLSEVTKRRNTASLDLSH